MKSSVRNRNGIVLFVCLFLGTVLTHWLVAAEADARLVIRRAPDLGANVIVKLGVDGQTTYLTYGHTYVTMLTPGKHTITVAPTPNATWKTSTPMALNMHSGQTYTLTTRNDNSGHLTLLPRS